MKRFNLSKAVAALVVAGVVATSPAGSAQSMPVGTPCPSYPSHEYVLCEGNFVLCDNATCTAIPKQTGGPGSPSTIPDTALCDCTVLYGRNLGPAPKGVQVTNYTNPEEIKKICELRSGPGSRQLMSTYSFALGASHRKMTCPAGPHTTCYGYPCEIDPDNPEKARCTCPILWTGEFVTMGGDCREEECSDLRQGGLTIDSTCLNEALAEAIGLEKPPVNDCPASGM